jgi:predicted metal-dependent phosphoesterase TrpH
MYTKIDLHIHTPISSCYVDHVVPEANLKTSSQDIVTAALDAGLAAIAITDHNSAEGIDGLTQAAKGSGLCILPGLELSARGGHVLALFEEEAPVPRLRHLLGALGFTEEEGGRGYCETEHRIDYVFQKIEEHGGLAIAAHVDRKPKGFLASEELATRDKRKILANQHLAAIEITVQRDRALWNRGSATGYPRKIACIQGSDAHAPSEVGRRPIYVQIPSLTLEGLRLALAEPESRIAFPGEGMPGEDMIEDSPQGVASKLSPPQPPSQP